MLGFALLCDQLHPGAAVFWQVYFWVYSGYEVGVLFLNWEEGQVRAACGNTICSST
jgi:hypothetical protein